MFSCIWVNPFPPQINHPAILSRYVSRYVCVLVRAWTGTRVPKMTHWPLVEFLTIRPETVSSRPPILMPKPEHAQRRSPLRHGWIHVSSFLIFKPQTPTALHPQFRHAPRPRGRENGRSRQDRFYFGTLDSCRRPHLVVHRAIRALHAPPSRFFSLPCSFACGRASHRLGLLHANPREGVFLHHLLILSKKVKYPSPELAKAASLFDKPFQQGVGASEPLSPQSETINSTRNSNKPKTLPLDSKTWTFECRSASFLDSTIHLLAPGAQNIQGPCAPPGAPGGLPSSLPADYPPPRYRNSLISQDLMPVWGVSGNGKPPNP
jgi:hypothetical protein